MKVQFIIGVVLLILLTTITTKQKIIITKFNIKEIILVNSISLKEKDVKKSLSVIYNKNLLFLKNKEIEELTQENAVLTESVNDLEVCVGQLVKEVRFLKAEVVKNYGKIAAK